MGYTDELVSNVAVLCLWLSLFINHYTVALLVHQIICESPAIYETKGRQVNPESIFITENERITLPFSL